MKMDVKGALGVALLSVIFLTTQVSLIIHT